MSMKPCKECNNDVSDRAKVCPHCGIKHPTTKNWQVAVFIAFIALAFVYTIYEPELTPEQTAADELADRTETCSSKFDAIYMSTVFVQGTLASPSTAKFPSAANNRVVYKYLDGCEHHINSYVDAQNLYGATVRNEYYAILKYSIEHDSWSLIDLSL